VKKLLCFLGFHDPEWAGDAYTMSNGRVTLLFRDRRCRRCGKMMATVRYTLA